MRFFGARIEWTVVTRDLWKDFGDATLTGIVPTACGGAALFFRVELFRKDDSFAPTQSKGNR